MEQRLKNILSTNGRAVAHFVFPNDIEYYFYAFELVDSRNLTTDFFAFPVNPQSINYTDRNNTSIKRTYGGITTLRTSTFDPKQFLISGTFGQRFKTVFGGKPISFDSISFNRETGISFDNFRFNASSFSLSVKNGYGCVKLLERIFKKADQLDDDGNPYRLHFYNTSMNQAFIIEPEDFQIDQNSAENLLYKYSLRFTAIADLSDVKLFNRFSLGRILSLSAANNALNQLSGRIDTILRDAI